ADAAAVDQLAVLIGTKDQRGHSPAGVAWAVTADHELLSFRAFYFEPTGGAVADIATVRALGDDALVAAGAHGVEDLLAVVGDMAGKLQAVVRVPLAQQFRKPFLALEQGPGGQILAVQFQQVE